MCQLPWSLKVGKEGCAVQNTGTLQQLDLMSHHPEGKHHVIVHRRVSVSLKQQPLFKCLAECFLRDENNNHLVFLLSLRIQSLGLLLMVYFIKNSYCYILPTCPGSTLTK